MAKIPFNDDNSNKGIEGWYAIVNGKLIIYIKPTNSKEDWISDFIAFRKYDKSAGCKVHKGFKIYAHWMNVFIIQKSNAHNIKNIYIFGYSMGGGIAQILGEFNNNYHIISIDGPRTTTNLTNHTAILYYNRGSLVNRIPPWFKRIKNTVCLNNKWRPFWKSHVDYNIDKIINNITKSNK